MSKQGNREAVGHQIRHGSIDETKDIYAAFDNVKICFCTLCNHDRAYGHCYACRCHNHQPEPQLDDEGRKLKATVDHIRKLFTGRLTITEVVDSERARASVRITFSKARILDLTDCEWKDLRIVIEGMQRTGADLLPEGFAGASYGCVRIEPSHSGVGDNVGTIKRTVRGAQKSADNAE